MLNAQVDFRFPQIVRLHLLYSTYLHVFTTQLQGQSGGKAYRYGLDLSHATTIGPAVYKPSLGNGGGWVIHVSHAVKSTWRLDFPAGLLRPPQTMFFYPWAKSAFV